MKAFRSGLFPGKALTLALLFLPWIVSSATYTVTSTANSGAGTLRQALLDANANPGLDVITFSIGGGGLQTIAPTAVFPTVTDPVTINGATQPGYAGVPLIEINGGGRSFDGLVVETTNCVIRGLVVRNFGDFSVGRSGILITNGGGHVVVGCFLGTTAAGTAASRNSRSGISIINSPNNQIGGTNANEGNLVSGNSGAGIEITGTNSTGNIVANNLVGLGVFGTNAVANSGGGILVSNAPNNVIGGTNPVARNYVAGNSSENIRLISPAASGNQIVGNWIGMRTNGLALTVTYASADGIRVDNAPSNSIGGVIAEARNVIANVQSGIRLTGSNANANVVRGNFIGVSLSGSQINSNLNGISISAQANGNIIGGSAPGAGNLISGNRNFGIEIFSTSGTLIQGNLIGTDLSGQAAVPNGITGSGGGISLGTSSQSATNNLIGGTQPGERNVISGNRADGLIITGGPASNNVVAGNLIGVAADGVTAMGNAKRGIITVGACYNLIGGAEATARNIIANNGLDGVWLAATFGAFGTPGTNNVVRGNLIYSNGVVVVANGGYAAGVTLLGPNVISSNIFFGNIYADIDRGGDGPTANVDGGPANSPELSTARQGSTIIDGQLRGKANCVYYLEYDLVSGQPSRENPPVFLGFRLVMTDGSGVALIHEVFVATAPVGAKVRAIATSSLCGPSETSEFSLDVTVGPGSAVGVDPSTLTGANHVMAGSANDPVSTFTGELYNQEAPDIDLGGPMPMRFSRYYASLLKRGGATGTLGDNWRHNFELTLSNSPTFVRIVNELGRVITFTNDGSGWKLSGRTDIAFQLATNGGNYILGDPRSQRLFTFDATGKLVSIADGRGNTQSLAYTGGLLASVSDGLGRSLSFQYDGGGALTNVTDGLRSVGFTQTGGNLASVRDTLGFTTSYSYDPTNGIGGLLTATVLPEGNTPFAQTWNTNGQVVSQTEAGVNVTSLAYSNSTTVVTQPTGTTLRHVHTATGELAAHTDEDGFSIPIVSDADGRRAVITDRLGGATRIAYHAPSGKPAAVTNVDGTVTLFGYTARTNAGVVFHDLSRVVYPDGTSESFVRDGNGNVLASTNRAGKVFNVAYTARGQVLASTNPAGGVVQFAYNADGTLASRTDSDTGVTQFFYDSLRRLTNVVNPDGSFLRSVFDANDRLVSLTDERTNTTTFYYDQNNHPTQIVDAAGKTNRIAYDARNRPVAETDRLGRTSGRRFDSRGFVASVTNRNGFVTTFARNNRQWLASVVDPGGKTWSFGYDNEGLATSSSNPLNQTSYTALDPLGYPVALTNALNQTVRLVRDEMRRVTNVVDQINRTNTFRYEERGLLAAAAKPLVGQAAYQRNSLGLLSQITGLNGEQWTFGYSPMGRPVSVTDPLNRTTTSTYDSRGRLQRTAYPDGVSVTNFYDGAGNLVRRRYSDGTDHSYAYDPLDRLASTTELSFAYDAEGRVTNTVSSGVNYRAAYDADGRLTSVAYHDGAFTAAYLYDSRDRLTRVSDSLTGAQVDFAYDDAGRLTGMTRANGVNGSYTYDAAGRLIRIQESSFLDLQHSLNPAAEVASVAGTWPLDPANYLPPSVANLAYDAAHQVVSPGHSFDARGRQSAAPGRNYGWNGASRLTSINGVTLGYNGLDDLVTRTQGGATTRFFYNHAVGMTPIMAEKNDTTGQVLRYYVWSPGGRLLYAIDAANGNAVSYFHFDRVGSTLALTSAAGNVTDRYAYSPYGVLLARTGPSQQPFTFVGAWGVRSEGTLYQMRARYYDPATARFLSRDPAWPRLGSVTELNPYNYAVNNPLAFYDANGRSPQRVTGYENLTEDEWKNLTFDQWFERKNRGVRFEELHGTSDRAKYFHYYTVLHLTENPKLNFMEYKEALDAMSADYWKAEEVQRLWKLSERDEDRAKAYRENEQSHFKETANGFATEESFGVAAAFLFSPQNESDAYFKQFHWQRHRNTRLAGKYFTLLYLQERHEAEDWFEEGVRKADAAVAAEKKYLESVPNCVPVPSKAGSFIYKALSATSGN